MVQVRLTRRAERDLKRLSQELQDRVKAAIRVLAEEPLRGEQLLGKFRGLRRYRVGEFRIVYALDKQAKAIEIITLGHRREVYR